MSSKYRLYLEKRGIREFETYSAVVVEELYRGCLIRVRGVDGRQIYLKGQYPAGTELYISFDICFPQAEVRPVVEWVESYGSDCSADEKSIA